MADDMEDETGGGVMVVFSSKLEKRGEIPHSREYVAQALRAQRLIVSEHEPDRKTSQPRYERKLSDSLLQLKPRRVYPSGQKLPRTPVLDAQQMEHTPIDRGSRSRESFFCMSNL